MSNMTIVKKGFLSPYQMGFLAGMSDAVTKLGESAGTASTNMESIFYGTAFQCGVEQFLVWPLDKNKLDVSDFVKNRMFFLPKNKNSRYALSERIIRNTFDNHLPSDYRTLKKYEPVRSLEYFLQDVMVAMHARSSLLTVMPLPNINKLHIILPSSLLVPVRNLLNSVKHEDISVPVPRLVMSADDVKRYQDILSSGLYSEYSRAHEELEHSTTVTARALANVVRAGRRVFVNNQAVLTLRSTALEILSATPQIIETAFGKLPGAFSEVACKIGMSLMKDKRNLVIYTFDPLLKEVATTEARRMLLSPQIYSKYRESINKSYTTAGLYT